MWRRRSWENGISGLWRPSVVIWWHSDDVQMQRLDALGQSLFQVFHYVVAAEWPLTWIFSEILRQLRRRRWRRSSVDDQTQWLRLPVAALSIKPFRLAFGGAEKDDRWAYWKTWWCTWRVELIEKYVNYAEHPFRRNHVQASSSLLPLSFAVSLIKFHRFVRVFHTLQINGILEHSQPAEIIHTNIDHPDGSDQLWAIGWTDWLAKWRSAAAVTKRWSKTGYWVSNAHRWKWFINYVQLLGTWACTR